MPPVASRFPPCDLVPIQRGELVKSDMMLAIKKGPSPKPLPKVENIHIMVHRHACSKAAYEKTNQQPKVDKSMWTPVLHGAFVMHEKTDHTGGI